MLAMVLARDFDAIGDDGVVVGSRNNRHARLSTANQDECIERTNPGILELA